LPRAIPKGLKAAIGPWVSQSMRLLVRRGLLPLLARASAATASPALSASGRRFCILHLDGVSRQSLVRAIDEGQMPFLARLLSTKAYRLSNAWSGAPASTPAFQAGLLYGAQAADIPSFVWFDRGSRREVRMDRATDAARVESQLRENGGALLEHGSAAFSIFPGGARRNAMTRSSWGMPGELSFVDPALRHDHWQLGAATTAHALTAARIVRRLFSETLPAVGEVVSWSRKIGRVQHEPTFLMNKMALCVGAREAATWGTVLDMARGVPALYSCFSDYDEIAHRRQPDAGSAFEALRGIDWSLEHIFAAADALPERRYDLYVLSDHGQVITEPFEAITGVGLLDYIALAEPGPDDGSGARVPFLDGSAVRQVQRLRAIERAASNVLPESTRQQVHRGVLAIARALRSSTSGDGRGEALEEIEKLEDIECIEAGDLAHLYLGKGSTPLACGEIERRYPNLLRLLVQTPAIGVVAAREGTSGVAFWQRRRFDLSDAADCQALDLGYGGAMTREFLLKMLSLPSAGDLVVYGNGANCGLHRHVAFSWEFGSHAGIGQEEVETFVIHPSGVTFDFGRAHHSAELHRFFCETYER
jgi:hypothetical protein